MKKSQNLIIVMVMGCGEEKSKSCNIAMVMRFGEQKFV